MATRGRPQFKPTPVQRRKVANAVACGMSEDAIALAIGISRPTLRKHFRVELDTGAAQRRMEAMDALLAKVRKGNVSAIRTYLAIGTVPAAKARGRGAPPAAAPADGEATAPAAPMKAPRLGKKEVAAINAETAAQGRFGPRPAPLKLVGGG